MLYNISFDVVAIFIFLILLAFFGKNKKVPLIQYRSYNFLLLICLATAVFDIISSVAISYPMKYNVPWLYFTSIMYYVFQNLVIVIYTYYIFTLANIDIRKDKRSAALLILPITILCIVIASSTFTKAVFWFDSDMVYHYGSLNFLVYVSTAYYFIVGAVTIYTYRRMISKEKRVALYSFAILIIISVIVQCIMPRQLLHIFTTSICTIMIIFTIQNPEEVFDVTTGAMLYNPFIAVLDSFFISKHSFTIITVHIKDYSFICSKIGAVGTDAFFRQVVLYLGTLEKECMVGRINNRTFAVKLPDNSSGDTERFITEIKNRFSKPWESETATTMLSVQLSCINCPDDAKSVDEFYDALDVISTTNSREDVIYVKDLSNIGHMNEIRHAVRNAVENNGFEVYYQPIYSTQKKKIIAAEALIRLNDENLGFISPELFIPIAEKDGYILQIGEFVFESVCSFISQNELYKRGIEYIEVNLSVVQCMQYQLAENFISIMNKYNVPPECINFEITETAAINSFEALKRNMSILSENNILFSLDDYGTGYSNISYVYNLPFKYIKIDKSILWSSLDNPKAYVTLKNTFQKVQRLGMKIIMEGVETEEQIKKLLELKCDYFQGYYFSKAIPPNQFIDYIHSFCGIEIE